MVEMSELPTAEDVKGIIPLPPATPAVIPQQTVKDIAVAIAGVMKEVGIVSKRGNNTFHHYKYASMQDVLQKLTPLLAKHGLIVMQNEIGRSMFDGDRTIAIQYAFTIFHTSGEVWPERPVQTGMSRCRDSRGGFDDKSINKCHTAARKYFLLSLFQIATGDEDDADNEKPPSRPIPKHDPSTGEIDDEIPDFAGMNNTTGPVVPPPSPVSAADKVGAPSATNSTASARAPAETPDERRNRFLYELETAAEEGEEELRRAWLLIPPRDRPALADDKDRLKERAVEVDAAKLL